MAVNKTEPTLWVPPTCYSQTLPKLAKNLGTCSSPIVKIPLDSKTEAAAASYKILLLRENGIELTGKDKRASSLPERYDKRDQNPNQGFAFLKSF